MKTQVVLQAIRTKYHGATNHRGSRITATSAGGSKLTIPYPHELNAEQAHRKAAELLVAKLDWLTLGYQLVTGSLSDSYVHVLARE